MIKLIGIDLDGTLLRHDKSISKANKVAIRLALDKGVKVAICTGRPLEAIQHILDELGTNTEEHYSITYNGGLIIQNKTREVKAKTAFTLEETQPIAEPLLGLELPVVQVGLDAVYRRPYPKGHPSYYEQSMIYMPFEDLNQAQLGPDFPIYKLVISTETNHLEEKLSLIPKSLYERYSVMRSHPHQLEIMPKGVDKGQGLKALAEHLNISQSDVMGIGDEENDLAMLQWVGHAVVMDNARAEIKAYANYVTSSNEADGVAEAIHHLVL